MSRKLGLLVALCLTLLSLGFALPVQAICHPCDCVSCTVGPDSCCYAVGQGNIHCSDWSAQNCPL